jgi:RecA-family ATPase
MPIPNITHPSPFIVDPLLPTREIHLLAGGSGAGKSTFACQIAETFIAGGDFFGHPLVRPQKVGYMAFDRSHEGMRRTLLRSSTVLPIGFPYYSAITSPEFHDPKHHTPDGAIDRFIELHPETDILFLDGIGMAFQGDSSSLSEVSKFVHRLVRKLAILPHPLTIIALHHMAKTKKGNEYAKPRERLHGSVAWAATCETCILIEAEEADLSSPARTITICPRNAPERVFTYEFDEDGRLQRAADPDKRPNKLEQLLDSLAVDIQYTFTEIEEIATKLDISERTWKRYLNQLCMDNRIRRVKRGVYERAKSN